VWVVENMMKKTVVRYLVAVVLTTFLSIAVAEYIQRGPLPFPAEILTPIMIPLVFSYWSSSLFNSAIIWRFLFAGASLALNLLLFLPVLLNEKFKTQLAFMSVQTAVLAVYVLISIPFFKMFARWMSV